MIFWKCDIRILQRAINCNKQQANYEAEVRFSRIQVRWDKGGPEAAHDYTDFYARDNCNRAFGISSFVHNRIRSTVKRVEFVTDSISYIILWGRGYGVYVSTNFHIYSGDYSLPLRERTYFEIDKWERQFTWNKYDNGAEIVNFTLTKKSNFHENITLSRLK